MFLLPDLPYDYIALEPTVSEDTLRFHHDKHHRTYVDKTNELAKKAGLEDLSLEELVRAAKAKGDKTLFNNAAQAWNHAFFWQSMTPETGAPEGAFKAAIDKAFGGQPALKEDFVKQGAEHFGSGWVWLVSGADGLKVITTHDADGALIREGLTPLLVCDLWEHAYYLDYQNDRKKYLTAWFDKVANWDFAGRQFTAAEGGERLFHYPLAA